MSTSHHAPKLPVSSTSTVSSAVVLNTLVFNAVFAKQHKVFDTALLNTLNPSLGSSLSSSSSPSLGHNADLALGMQVSLESYGFSFSKTCLSALSYLSEDGLSEFWSKLRPQVEIVTGAHRAFQPMYPQFPKQVLDASEVELMTNAFMHYAGSWMGLRILPKYKPQVRLPLLDTRSPKTIDVATLADVEDLFVNLNNANTSLGASDKACIKTLLDYFESQGSAVELLGRCNFPQKENLAQMGAWVLGSSLDFNEVMRHHFTTPTDVLRLTAALFKGDTSLATPTRIGSLSRPLRRALMATLETQLMHSGDVAQNVENFFTYKEQWVRVGHALHVGEHAAKFPLVAQVFQDLRTNNKPVTFNSLVEAALDAQNIPEAVSLLSQRPGVFARYLNRLLQDTQTSQDKAVHVLTEFSQCARSVSTPVLTQLHSHFLHQHEKKVRAFMPKGGLSKLFVTDNKAKIIAPEVAQMVAGACEAALAERFAALPPLGRVYVDPALKTQNTPFAQRSASKALVSVARGSRFAMDAPQDNSGTQESKNNIVRLFLWWNEQGKNKKGEDYNIGRIDIDLSCVLMDKNYQQIDVCSYYNLTGTGLAHSGDIVSAPQGACEFIDVNLDEISKDVRYVVMTISSYTQQKYCDMPECFAGWMTRSRPQAGEIFDARTVANKVDLTSESKQMMPAIFDTQTREFIWADIAVKVGYGGVNNVENSLSSIGYNVKAIVNLIKPNLHDLFTMHGAARGTLVDNKAEADTVFSLHEGITPYMFERIASEFLANPQDTLAKKAKP